MKFLLKVKLIAISMTFALNATSVIARHSTEAAKVANPSDAVESATTPNTGQFTNDDAHAAYALGASLARYIESSLKEQEKLGIKLEKEQLITGVKDVFANKIQLSDADIEKALQRLEARIKVFAKAKIDRDLKENKTKDIKYRETFAKEKGVKQTESGLLFQIQKEGVGIIPQDSDTVIVNYKGSLTDGSEFDNSYTTGAPLSARLDSVIPGWAEGLKHIKKGGKIKLVIPPELAYSKNRVPGIPANSTLVFDVELLDVQAAQKSGNKTETPSDVQAK